MEWGRIKNLFIYLFLLLNIVLIALYIYISNNNSTNFYREQEAIINAMKQDNIIIEENSIKRESLPYITASIKRMDTNIQLVNNYSYRVEKENAIEKIIIDFDKSVANVNNQNYIELLNSLTLSDLSANANYVYDFYYKLDKKIRYAQVVDTLEIFDNKNANLEFEVLESGDIKTVKKTYLSDFKREKQEKLASYTQVIYKLYHDNLIPRNSRVKSKIGYYSYISQAENQILIPTWKISVQTMAEEKIYYVDAVNTKLLGTN